MLLSEPSVWMILVSVFLEGIRRLSIKIQLQDYLEWTFTEGLVNGTIALICAIVLYNNVGLVTLHGALYGVALIVSVAFCYRAFKRP